MSDERLAERWRTWCAESTPDNAQAYCVELARSDQAPAKATRLDTIDWDKVGERTYAAIINAADRVLGKDEEEAFLEELHWLTECHYWALGQASPGVLRSIAQLYKSHGMELRQGDEEQAEADLRHATSSASTAGLREKIRELQDEVNNLRGAKRELEFARAARDKLQSEVNRTSSLRAKLHKLEGIESVNAKLKAENERLAKIIQDQAKEKAQ